MLLLLLAAFLPSPHPTDPTNQPTTYKTTHSKQVARFVLSADKEGRLPDLRWLDEEGCAVVHRVAAAGDVGLLELLLQVR